MRRPANTWPTGPASPRSNRRRRPRRNRGLRHGSETKGSSSRRDGDLARAHRAAPGQFRGVENEPESIGPHRERCGAAWRFRDRGRARHARGRLIHRLSVRQGRRGARLAREPAPRNAGHRIHRHGRRTEAVLRRRRRALPRCRERIAPDESVRGEGLRRQRSEQDHRDPGRDRRDCAGDRQGLAAAERDDPRLLRRSRENPMGEAEPREDVEGRQRPSAGASDPGLRTPADVGNSRRARRADHDGGLRNQWRHGRAQEDQREQVQGDLHGDARGRRLHRGRRKRQSDRSEARGESGHGRHLRLFLSRREYEPPEGHRDQRRQPDL